MSSYWSLPPQCPKCFNRLTKLLASLGRTAPASSSLLRVVSLALKVGVEEFVTLGLARVAVWRF